MEVGASETEQNRTHRDRLGGAPGRVLTQHTSSGPCQTWDPRSQQAALLYGASPLPAEMLSLAPENLSQKQGFCHPGVFPSVPCGEGG